MSFFFLLPNILLSAASCSRSRRCRGPRSVLAQALPLTHFLRIVRGITLKGAASPTLRRELVWLAGILVALVPLASLRFRKKLA